MNFPNWRPGANSLPCGGGAMRQTHFRLIEGEMPTRLRVRVATLAALLSMAGPAHAQISVLGPLVREEIGIPGRSYAGTIVLHNTSDQVQEARLTRADYSFSADGRTLYDAPGTSARSNAKWITLTPASLTIAPHQSATVGYTVQVPADANPLAGTYWSVVQVETIPSGSAGSSVGSPKRPQPRPRLELTLNVRVNYAIQFATHIGQTGTSRIEFAQLAPTIDDRGHKELEFDFLNTGERAHRLVLSVELYAASGKLVGKFQQRRGLLYPGTSARQRFDLGSIPAGSYTALLLADGGGGEIFAGQFPLKY